MKHFTLLLALLVGQFAHGQLIIPRSEDIPNPPPKTTSKVKESKISWALSSTTGKSSDVTELAVLPNGDAVIAGHHDSDFSFGGHSSRAIPGSAVGGGHSAGFVARVTPEGKVVWMKPVAKSTNHLYLHDLSTDDDGNIWVIGSYDGSLQFSNGQAAPKTGNLNDCIWLARLNEKGQMEMAKTYPYTNSRVHHYHVLAAENKQCFIVANHGSCSFEGSELPSTGSGQFSQFAARVRTDGSVSWAKSLGGQGSRLSVTDLIYNEDGNLLVTGYFRGVNLSIVNQNSQRRAGQGGQAIVANGPNPAAEINTVSRSVQSIDGFIAEFKSTTGLPMSFTSLPSSGSTVARDIQVDEEGNRYFTVTADQNFTLGTRNVQVPAGGTMAVVKTNSKMEPIWIKLLTNTGTNRLSKSNVPGDLHLDGESVYVTGMLGVGGMKLDDVTLSTTDLWSAFTVKLQANNGKCVWGINPEPGKGSAIHMCDGRGYLTGWFHKTATFGDQKLKVQQSGYHQIYLARLGSTEVGSCFEEEEDSTSSDSTQTNPLVSTDGAPDGSATVLAGAGTQPYSYEWTNRQPEPRRQLSPSQIHRRMHPELYKKKKPTDDRAIEDQEFVEVRSTAVDVTIWDDLRVDGDVISLLYDGEALLENYNLTDKRKKVRIEISKTQDNQVILYAVDQGDIPPTTCAVKVSDGFSSRVFVLRSDLQTNGAVVIKYKAPKHGL